MDGYLLIDKPAGWTSFDVVNKIRFMVADHLRVSPKQAKVGHSGTLDPMATGLLILLIGDYTKRQAEFMKQDKTYLAEITLGATSDTDDAEGVIERAAGFQPPDKPKVIAALKQFVGLTRQVPPQYSALKLQGQKAYELARSGRRAELRPRPVTIYEISDIEYDWPKLRLKTRVSSGTYIRSLARDVGQKLGTGGYLSQLRRVAIGSQSVTDAVNPDKLKPSDIESRLLQA